MFDTCAMFEIDQIAEVQSASSLLNMFALSLTKVSLSPVRIAE